MRVTFVGKIVVTGLLAGWLASAFAGTKSTSTWTASDVQPRAYRKVLVLAKITDDVARRVLEDSVVKGLAERGIAAVPAYEVLTPADVASEETIRAKAAELGIDGGVVFTVTGQDPQFKSGPAIHASVGVPVHAGPFSMFLGTSVPLGGGGSTVKNVGVKAAFYGGEAGTPVWIGNYSTDLKAGSEREAQQMASQTLKQLGKAGVFKKP